MNEVFCGVEQVDQRALAEVVFFRVGLDDLARRFGLQHQGRDAIGGDHPRRPRLVDGFICVALQAGMRHRGLVVAFRRLGALPDILAAAENVPRRHDLEAAFGKVLREAEGVVAFGAARLERDIRHESACRGVECFTRSVAVGLRGLDGRIVGERDRKRRGLSRPAVQRGVPVRADCTARCRSPCGIWSAHPQGCGGIR